MTASTANPAKGRMRPTPLLADQSRNRNSSQVNGALQTLLPLDPVTERFMPKPSDIVAKHYARFVTRLRESCCVIVRCVGRFQWLLIASFLVVVLGIGMCEPVR